MINLDILRSGKIIGCGCSRFGGSMSEKEAIKTLHHCFNNGVIYYDVARSYGYGKAESIVGRFARDKRDKIILSSKYGIDVIKSFPLRNALASVARLVKTYVPNTTGLIRGVANNNIQKVSFSPEMVIASLDKSLSELRTDYLDTFIYHEANYSDFQNDDVKDVLSRQVEKGKIRVIGYNFSNQNDLQNIIQTDAKPDLIQVGYTCSDTFTKVTAVDNQINIVYSIMSAYEKLTTAQKKAIDHERIQNENLGNFRNNLEILLYIAYRDLKSGVLLMSTAKENHIKRNIEITSLTDTFEPGISKIKSILRNS